MGLFKHKKLFDFKKLPYKNVDGRRMYESPSGIQLPSITSILGWFKKDSLKKHFPLNFHLLLETDLPDNSFTINQNCYHVPSIFQIWERRDIEREVPKKHQPIHFQFVKKTEHPDISFRRVGINAGTIDKKIENKSEQSHYFIKFNKPVNEAKFKKLSQITFQSKNDTVGPRSISKNELIKEFNTII